MVHSRPNGVLKTEVFEHRGLEHSRGHREQDPAGIKRGARGDAYRGNTPIQKHCLPIVLDGRDVMMEECLQYIDQEEEEKEETELFGGTSLNIDIYVHQADDARVPFEFTMPFYGDDAEKLACGWMEQPQDHWTYGGCTRSINAEDNTITCHCMSYACDLDTHAHVVMVCS